MQPGRTLSCCSPPILYLLERLWKLTKKECLAGRQYPAFARLRTAMDTCLNGMAGDFLPELQCG